MVTAQAKGAHEAATAVMCLARFVNGASSVGLAPNTYQLIVQTRHLLRHEERWGWRIINNEKHP